MKLANSSSEYNEEYICTYKNPVRIDKKSVWGFKLVQDRGENFYSIGTGKYRYQRGRVLRKSSNYSNVYKDTEYYCEDMIGKTAIFKTLTDLKSFYPEWEDDNVCILVIELTGDIIEINASNKYHNCDVYAGSIIKTLHR